MIVAISISPSGSPVVPDDGADPADTADTADGGVSAVVAEAVRAIRASGLPCETNAMFTNIEGDWDEVMTAVKRAVDVVAERYPRVGLVLKADIRPGYDGQLTAKVQRVEEHLRER
ncbi:MAG: thiamine-binding protein [Marmoricola sp.]